MRNTVLKFGLLSGVIMVGLTFIIGTLLERDVIGMGNAVLVGYAEMLIALSMVFLGVRSYRDGYSGGIITFWKGLQIGLLISAIAALFYFLGSELYSLLNPGFLQNFFEKYSEYHLNGMRARGVSEADIATTAEEMKNMWEMLKNPLIRFGVSLIEILPVGIIVSLLSAGLLKKREVLQS